MNSFVVHIQSISFALASPTQRILINITNAEALVILNQLVRLSVIKSIYPFLVELSLNDSCVIRKVYFFSTEKRNYHFLQALNGILLNLTLGIENDLSKSGTSKDIEEILSQRLS